MSSVTGPLHFYIAEIQVTSCFALPLMKQDGKVLHTPSDLHNNNPSPLSSYPVLQVTTAVAPYVVRGSTVNSTTPLVGCSGVLQSMV